MYHRTNIDTQLSKNNNPFFVAHPPSQVTVSGETGRTKPTAREWPSSAFLEVVLPVESVYNQTGFAGPGHRVNSVVARAALSALRLRLALATAEITLMLSSLRYLPSNSAGRLEGVGHLVLTTTLNVLA